MKITKKKYYIEDFDESFYIEAQVKRHNKKLDKKRSYSYYEKCINPNFIKENSEMLCLGTRNNHERDVLKDILKEKNVVVKSLDIAAASGADYIMDFRNLPKEWNNKWDVIFSNSIDHAPNPEQTLSEWLSIIKVGGIAILGFDMSSHEGTSADCSVFDKVNLRKYFMDNSDFEVLSFSQVSGYDYYTIKRV